MKHVQANAIAQLAADEEVRIANVRDKRRRVDALRATHDRLRREVEALDATASEWRSSAAVEAMRAELARVTTELRAANRALIASI